MAQHHPDRHDQPRPAPPDILSTYKHTHSSPSVFPCLSPRPSTPSLLCSTSLLSSSHRRCSFIWLTFYLSRLLPALVFWCRRGRCVHGVGGITCLCHRFPSGSRYCCLTESPCGIIHASTYIHSVLHLFSCCGVYTVFSARLWCHYPHIPSCIYPASFPALVIHLFINLSKHPQYC